jgi:AbrB family looped-hinge helix DNA binding protein
MHKDTNTTKKMKVFPKGQVIIPVDLRRKYNINVGDQIEFVTIQDGILLKPSNQKPGRGSLTEELFGMLRRYAEGKDCPDDNAIDDTTQKEFTDGWKQ